MGFTKTDLLFVRTFYNSFTQRRDFPVSFLFANFKRLLCYVFFRKAILDWRQKGVRVICWTANSPTDKQYFARSLKITYLTDTLTGEATTHMPM